MVTIARYFTSRFYRGSPVPVTGAAAAQRLTGLHGLGAVARKREPL
jgi:hypothetical protein